MKRVFIATLALLTFAVVASAQMMGPGMPPPVDMAHGGPDFGHGGGLFVGSDGTVYLTTRTGSAGSATTTVTAISPSGSKLWSVTLPSGGHGLLLSGSNLITSSITKNSDGTFTSTLTAISTSSGATAWTKTFSGMADAVGTFNGVTSVVVTVPATTSGGTATRSLVALASDGSTLWTISI